MYCLVVSLMPWDTEGACNVHLVTTPQASEVTGTLRAASTDGEADARDVLAGVFD